MAELDKDIRKKHDLRTRQGKADAEREQKDRDEAWQYIADFLCSFIFIYFLGYLILADLDFDKEVRYSFSYIVICVVGAVILFSLRKYDWDFVLGKMEQGSADEGDEESDKNENDEKSEEANYEDTYSAGNLFTFFGVFLFVY